jgi:hypothetical protein
MSPVRRFTSRRNLPNVTVKEMEIVQLEFNRLNRLLSFEDIVEKYGGPPHGLGEPSAIPARLATP